MNTTAIEIQCPTMTFSGFDAGPADGPLVIFLHGFPQFADAWMPVLQAVAARGFRALAFDQRGYSDKARPEAVEDYRTSLLAKDVIAVADSLGAKKFHLVGHDWGGFLAWHLAARAPERILSITSVSTPHPGAYMKALGTDWDQRRRSLYLLLFRLPSPIPETILKLGNWRLLRAIYQGKLSEKDIQRNIERLGDRQCLSAALNWYRSLEGRCGPSPVPTLFIWGTGDVALGRKAAELTRNYVNGPYRFEVLKSHSHWLLDENPGEVSRLLLEHLQSLSRIIQ